MADKITRILDDFKADRISHANIRKTLKDLTKISDLLRSIITER
jgi:hypothetical protein